MFYHQTGRFHSIISPGKLLKWCLLLFSWSIVAAQTTQTPAPAVELQGILARDKIEWDEDVTLDLFLSNKSSLPIILSRVAIISPSIVETARELPLPIQLAPFGTTHGRVTLHNTKNAKFGTHKIIITTDYTWPNDKQTAVSVQTLVLPLELSRRFEEEAKGFPGGTAAFLYLLLPVIPFFLSYQIVEQRRKNEPLTMPQFETKHIAPAFLAAIVVSFCMIVFSSQDAINYSSPSVFMMVLFVSLVAGAAIPGIRLVSNRIHMNRWGFSQNDDVSTYLRKALLSPHAPPTFQWVTGTIEGETWQGFLLKQPNGDMVLGPQLQVSPVSDVEDAFCDNKLCKPELLVQLAKKKSVHVQIIESVKRGDTDVNGVVVVDGLRLFQQTASATKAIVRATS